MQKFDVSNHVTQEALANELGVSPKHISHVECGTSSLSLKNFSMFCDLFFIAVWITLFSVTTKMMFFPNFTREITQILSTGTDADIDRLNRYLQVYIELLNAKRLKFYSNSASSSSRFKDILLSRAAVYFDFLYPYYSKSTSFLYSSIYIHGNSSFTALRAVSLSVPITASMSS